MATYLALIALARAQDPERFAFRTEKYEFRDDVPALDLLTGGAEARERMSRGERADDVAEAIATVDEADRAIVRMPSRPAARAGSETRGNVGHPAWPPLPLPGPCRGGAFFT